MDGAIAGQDFLSFSPSTRNPESRWVPTRLFRIKSPLFENGYCRLRHPWRLVTIRQPTQTCVIYLQPCPDLPAPTELHTISTARGRLCNYILSAYSFEYLTVLLLANTGSTGNSPNAPALPFVRTISSIRSCLPSVY